MADTQLRKFQGEIEFRGQAGVSQAVDAGAQEKDAGEWWRKNEEHSDMKPEVKGKRRVNAMTFPNLHVLYKMQVLERNCFKTWVTVAVTSDYGYAMKWCNSKYF